jgi:hypothetical protein
MLNLAALKLENKKIAEFMKANYEEANADVKLYQFLAANFIE